MKNRIIIISSILLFIITFYLLNPRFKFFVQYGIFLPSYCTNYEFKEDPDFFSLLGLDGHGAQAKFEISEDNIVDLIESIEPEKIWLKYSVNDINLSDETIEYGKKEIPFELKNGEIEAMLWSTETKGDYYNITIHKSQKGNVLVSISMPFTT